MADDARDVNALLQQWRAGNPEAGERLLAVTYDELRRIARYYMKNERSDHTLQPTALVHEAYLRLFHDAGVDPTSRAKYFALVAQQMRRQLIDHARRRRAVKRGKGASREDFEDVVGRLAAPDDPLEEITLDRLDIALKQLERESPRAAQVINLRFFGNLTNEEVAKELKCASGTVKRDFKFARAWLTRALTEIADS